MGKTARGVLILLIAYAVMLHTAWLLPAFEGPDEIAHFGYLTDLRRDGRLPPPGAYRTNLARQQSAQPPLPYLMAWGWSWFAPFDAGWNGELPFNPWYRTGETLGDNRTANLIGAGHPTLPTIEPAVHWARLTSVWMGVLAVAVALRAARLLLRGGWVYFAVLLFTLNPVLVRAFATFGNDAAALLFGTVGTYAVARLAVRPHAQSPRTALTLGALVGLGLLAKASLLIYPAVGVAVLAVQRRWRALFLFGAAAIVGLPWYAYLGVTTGDALGTAPHLADTWAYSPDARPSLPALLTNSERFVSIWYAGKTADITTEPLGRLPYLLPIALFALGALVWFSAWRHLPAEHRVAVLALALTCGMMFAAYLRWLTLFRSTSGRLVLPAYLPLVLLLALGLRYGLPGRAGRALRLLGGVGVAFIGAVYVPLLVQPLTYRVTTFPPEQVPTHITQTPLHFGAVVLVGYDAEPRQLRPGVPLHMTLCWRSDAATTLHITRPFTFSLVAPDDTVLADRVSLHGLGKLTRWEPGRAFCDRFRVPISADALTSGQGYRVAVGMIDPETGNPLPENDGRSPFVGWVTAPGTALTQADVDNANFRFDGELLLLNHEAALSPDGATITAEWGTAAWTARPLQWFVHVVDADGALLAQADVPLGEHIYPAAVWGQSERTHTQQVNISLPDGTGAYCVVSGLYDPQTGARAPAAVAGGTPGTEIGIEIEPVDIENDAVPLGCYP